MFKPLLRTLPLLSGNFSLNCFLTEIMYNGVEYECNIRNAKLTPLDVNINNNDIDINLLNGKYEYDVAKYYKYFSDTFYKSGFTFNKLDYQKLNKTNNIYERDKTFEYGVSRQNYSETGYQFNFYAPIYIDNINSIPDAFEIKIEINKSLEKIIKVNIKKENTYNYLITYIKRYIEKLDDKVIYCLHESNQGTYYGINVKDGGLIEIKDNTIGSIYNYQYTINNFDNIICEGFKRNNLIMKQIIPLSFSFNIEDFLNKKEFKEIKFNDIKISGKYIYKSIYSNFYDFEINYINYNYKYNDFNTTTGEFDIKTSDNVMDIGFPSLCEKRFYKYKYSNKLSPKICKWKLNYSDDKNPYIININFAFSKTQNSNVKYGNFPMLLNINYPNGYVDLDNLLLPISDNVNFYNENYPNEINKYKNFMDNNTSNWYNLINIDNSIFKNNYLWADVKNNYTYFKDVLYNINNISYDNDLPIINKFGVFVKPILKSIELNDNIKTKFLLTESNNYQNNCFAEINESLNNSNLYNMYKFTGDSNTSINNKKLISEVDLIYDIDGEIFKLDNYYDINKYYLLDDIYDIIKLKYPNNSINIINKFNQYLNTEIIESFIKLDIDNLKNMFNINNDGTQYKFIFEDEFKDLKNESFNNLRENLYIANNYLGVKENLYTLLKNDNLNINTLYNYSFFIKANFVSYENFIKYISKTFEEIFNSISDNNINVIIKNLDEYNYIPKFDNEKDYIMSNYFEKVKGNKIIDNEILENEINDYTNYIYIDPYSLYNFIKSLNIDNININKILNRQKYNLFCKFLNIEHLKEYFENLYKDEYNNVINNIKDNFKNYIYIKERLFVDINKYVNIKDRFIPLSDINENIFDDNLTYEEFLKNLTYENDYFVYTNMYTKDNGDIEKTKYILELFFNKDMYILSDELLEYSNILNINSENRVPLYLYKIDELKNYNKEIKYYNNLTNITLTDLNKTCVPLFSSIYKNDNSVNELYILFVRNIINSFICKNDIETITYYKYVKYNSIYYYKGNRNLRIENNIKSNTNLYNYLNDDNNIEMKNLLDKYNVINEDDLTDNIINSIANDIINDKDLVHKYISDYNIKFYSIYDPLNIYLNKDENNNVEYYDKYNLNIYKDEENNINYGYYIINVEFSNDNKSINIIDDSPNIFKINKVNNLELINTNIYSLFNLLTPFLKKIIFINFINLSKIIISPTTFTLNVNYYPVIYDNGNTENSYLYDGIFYNINNINDDNKYVYDIKFNKSNNKKMYLNRYLNYITPILKETTIIKDVGHLKFKSFDKQINSNNMFINDINIYNYNKIHLVNNYNPSINKIPENIEFEEYEYKNFNINKYYVLENEIIIENNNEISNNDINNYTSNNYIYDIFKKYINKYKKLSLNDDEILFLLNKYNINYILTPIKLNSFKSKKIYNLIYKFTLK